MKHKRFSDEQVIGVLKEHEAGAKVDDICRRHAITGATLVIANAMQHRSVLLAPAQGISA